jgi:hypothetical protein
MLGYTIFVYLDVVICSHICHIMCVVFRCEYQALPCVLCIDFWCVITLA